MAGLAVGNMARLGEYKKTFRGGDATKPSDADDAQSLADEADDEEASEESSTPGDTEETEHAAATPIDADLEDKTASTTSE